MIQYGPYILLEEEQTYKAPEGAKNAAKKALKWKEEHGDEVTAMTRTGWARANQLAKGENLSLSTVKRMAAFERHRDNSKISPEHKDEPWKDKGYVAWLGWGGDAGIAWAKKIVDKLDEAEEENPEDVIDRDGDPLDKDLWEKAIQAAKRKFTKYPSAYANAFAVKWYKDKGGKFTKAE